MTATNPYTLGDLSKMLNRPAIALTGIQKRFDLPACPGPAYSETRPLLVSFCRLPSTLSLPPSTFPEPPAPRVTSTGDCREIRSRLFFSRIWHSVLRCPVCKKAGLVTRPFSLYRPHHTRP